MGNRWCTPERRALIAEHYPAGMHLRDLRVLLAALPGPPLPENDSALGVTCNNLGFHRQALTTGRRMVTQAAPLEAPSPPPEPAPKTIRGWRTPERDALMRAEYPIGTSIRVIRRLLERLPGPPVPGDGAVQSTCIYMRLRRLPGVRAAQIPAKAPPAPVARPAPIAPPPPDPEPDPEPPSPEPDPEPPPPVADHRTDPVSHLSALDDHTARDWTERYIGAALDVASPEVRARLVNAVRMLLKLPKVVLVPSRGKREALIPAHTGSHA